MKYCSECGKQLEDITKYCPACGTAQDAEKPAAIQAEKRLPAMVITLSIITLLGSALGMLRGLFYQFLGDDDYERGYLLALINAATFAAAILMLRQKRFGYYLYLVFQVTYIVFTFYIASIYSYNHWDTAASSHGISFAWFVSAFFWIPSVILLGLYITFARKYFTRPKAQ